MKTQLYQQQQLKISQRQVQRLHLLQLNETELRSYIQSLSLENPLIEPAEEIRASYTKTEADSDPVTAEYRVPNNTAGSSVPDDKQDVFSRIGDAGGLEESLQGGADRILFYLVQDSVRTPQRQFFEMQRAVKKPRTVFLAAFANR